jgi:signal transduction histidine kinase
MAEQSIRSSDMRRPAIQTQFWTGRLRGLFAGLGYASLLALILIVSKALEDSANNLPVISASESARNIALSIWQLAVATLLPLPILILTINLAPLGVLKRIAWLSVPVTIMSLWSFVYLDLESSDWWPGTLADRFAAAALLAAVCQFNSSARGAAGTLMRTHIQSATLGAALDRTRLQLLRSQIEPHFLFNTLANIRTLAHRDRSAAVEMLDNLLRYLSAALPKLRQDDSPLAEEMQLLDAYLSIFRVRMGSRLSYAIDLPADLAQIRVPTMMLLTLVENALKHGINPIIEGGFIRVSAARSGPALVLKVADSGHGISDQQRQGTGTGLSNVRLRLMMQYGHTAQLSLVHAEPRGVVAAIWLPLGGGS